MAIANKDDGFIRANEDTPYPPEQLSGMFRVPLGVLKSTIEKCLRFGKLDRMENGTLYIKNWEAYSLTSRYRRMISEKTEVISAKEEHTSTKEEPKNKIEIEIKMEKDIKNSESRDSVAQSRADKPLAPSRRIQLILDSGPKRWEGITEEDKSLWVKAYPGVNVEQELQEMVSYWDAQPKAKRRINWARTIVCRFKWVQDKGGTRIPEKDDSLKYFELKEKAMAAREERRLAEGK
jgi:hypothetical protein